MADNIDVKDGAGATKTIAAKDRASVLTYQHYTDDGDNVALGAKADASASTDTGTFSLNPSHCYALWLSHR